MKLKDTIRSSIALISTGVLFNSCGGINPDSEQISQSPTTEVITDTDAPLAKIIFPMPVSRTNEPVIIIKGSANDVSGIDSIFVNGVIADVTVGETDEEVTWEAQIPTSRNVVVETKDLLGNVASSAASVEILGGEVPFRFIIDDANERIIGEVFELNQLVTVDLDTNMRSTIPIAAGGNRVELAYSEQEDKILFSQVIEGHLRISSVDPVSTLLTVELSYFIGEGSGDWGWLSIGGSDFSQEENSLYVLINYTLRDQSVGNKSLILKYDVGAKSISTIVDGTNPESLPIYTPEIAYSKDGLIIFNYVYLGNSSYSNQGLYRLSLDGATLDKLPAEANRKPRIMTVDNLTNTLYTVGGDGIEELSLLTSEVLDLSLEAETELNLSQTVSSDIDYANNQLLIADSDLDAVIAVDLETGNRSKYLHNGVGEGQSMIEAFDLVLDEENDVVYTADAGGNAPEVVLAIDLKTGNREVIGDIDLPGNILVNDVVLDKNNQILYVVLFDSVLKIQIDNEDTDVLTSNLIGAGPLMGSLRAATFDEGNSRLFVTDSTNDAVFSIDTATGDRTTISTSANITADTEEFKKFIDITLDVENNMIYALTQNLDGDRRAILKIDIDTGAQSIFATACTSPLGQVALPDSLRSISFLAQDNQLVMAGIKTVIYKENNECAYFEKNWTTDTVITEEGQLLATTGKEIVQIDLDTDQVVIISK